MHTLKLEMDGTLLEREEFRNIFRRSFRDQLGKLPYAWVPNIGNVLGEIVKNFYDHGDKKGYIEILSDDHGMKMNAYDFGPGYMVESGVIVTFEELLTQMEERTSWKKVSEENCGLGLQMINAGLHGLKKVEGITHLTYEVTTWPNFSYTCTIAY